MTVHAYLTRLSTYFQCSNECFVLGLVYINRILRLYPSLRICKLNVHRLVLTSLVLAMKFFDDVHYQNAYYAKVGGIQTKEMNNLEFEFLQLLNWKLHVSPLEFDINRKVVYKAANNQICHMKPQPCVLLDDGKDVAQLK